MTIYRLIARHPERHGCNETPHTSIGDLNRYKMVLAQRGFTDFTVDTYEVKR